MNIDKILEEMEEKIKVLSHELTEERKLNDELIAVNKKLAENGKQTNTDMIQILADNDRYRSVLKHGIFIEFDKEGKDMKYFPIMGDISAFAHKTPEKVMYTFTPTDLFNWLESVKKYIENSKLAIKVDPEDLK